MSAQNNSLFDVLFNFLCIQFYALSVAIYVLHDTLMKHGRLYMNSQTPFLFIR